MRKTKSFPRVTKKRTSKERAESLKPGEENGDENEQEDINKEGKGFYACYLLTSLCPRFKGHTYIGFTVNPRRRIRQHNGEIRSGAFRTKKRRPWEMVFCIYGFPTHVSALQFEWAWQHPNESVAVRQAAATFKSFSGVANKIKLAYTMLNLPAWQSLNITVNYFSTKYTTHSSGCPSLPEHMKVQVCPSDELPCYTETGESLLEFTDAENVFDDKEEYENATNMSVIVKENMTEIQAHSKDGFPSSSTKDSNVGEKCNKGSDASGTIKEAHADTIVHISLDDAHNINENTDEEFGWFKEYGKRHQTMKNTFAEYPPAEVGHAALVGSASSSLSTDFSMEEVNNGDGLTLMNKNVSDLNGKRFRDGAADKDPQPIYRCDPQEIEVIDLLSPSPGSRIRSTIKKRRLFTSCPEIIDLT